MNMKNVRVIVIAAVIILVICGGFFLFSQNLNSGNPDELTEVEKLEQIKELLPNLPKTIRDLFVTSGAGKNPITEANKYYQQVEQERLSAELQFSPTKASALVGREADSNSHALWDEFSRGMDQIQRSTPHQQVNLYGLDYGGYGSSDPYQDSYGGKDFNAEDYV